MIPICFSTDHNFIMPTGIAVQSMLKHSKQKDIEVIILAHKSVTEQDEAILNKITSQYSSAFRMVRMDDVFGNAYEIRGITTSTYYRLLIPWILPEYDKVMYCDGDVVFMGDISELYQLNINEYYVAGRKSSDVATPEFKKHVEQIGADYKTYINGGVQLLNAKKIREDNMKEKLLYEAKKKYLYQDQDILNVVFKDKILNFDIKWNFPSQACLIGWTNVVPCIIHYTGNKPWKMYTCYWFEWYNEYKGSPFYESNLQKSVYENIQNRKYSYKEILRIVLKQYIPGLYYVIHNRKRG